MGKEMETKKVGELEDRRGTRRAIREHVEGGREEVKTEGSEEEGRTSRENKRLKKKIKNNEGETGCCRIM